jgi:hypothetical protein
VTGTPLSRCGSRAVLYAPPRIRASLVSTTAIALTPTATCLGMPRAPLATCGTPPPTASAVVLATLSAVTPTPTNRRFDLFFFLCLGTLRGEEPQRGCHEGSAAELYRLTARDCAALQTPHQVVEARTPPSSLFINNVTPPFPHSTIKPKAKAKTGPPL